jgi:hypothetical protein
MKKDAQIRIVVYPPGQPPEARTIDNNLSSMQKVVGGKIELFPLGENEVLEGICNDEGLICGLEFNRYIPYLQTIIAGTFYITASRGAEFRSLTPAEEARAMQLFARQEVFE